MRNTLLALLVIHFCTFQAFLLNSAACDEDLGMGPIYQVDLSDVRNHYVTIRMEVQAAGNSTQLMMAVWTPGSYLVREYARHVDRVRAETAAGQPLEIEKVRKNRWQVATDGVDRIVVSYRIYCRELSVRTNFVNHEYAVLNGGPTFMTLPGQLDRPHRVSLVMPPNWKRSATSLADDPDQANAYIAANFDELVDSPIVAGNILLYPFTVGDVPHFLVNVGEQGAWDGPTAAKDLATMVAAHHKIWGTIPYDRYLFINVIGSGGGGLEHDNSCLMMTGRWTSRDKSRYKRWLTLASHEFFHTWNVRRLRPEPLRHYDYENEVYIKTLWVAEGVTSYYENLAMVRCGLITEKEFLSSLSRDIQSVQNTPGRTNQSLKESSWDSWIKFYRPDENSSNTRISYYSKGAVVAFLLDARIRAASDGTKSLDDVLRIMFDRYEKSGYTPEEFRAVSTEVAGVDLSDFFAVAVDSTDELNFDAALDWFGMEFSGRKRAAAGGEQQSDESKEQEDDEDKEDDEEQEISAEPWLGIRMSGNEVSSVTTESPATKAGINPRDEIIAVNGFRVSGSVDSLIARFEVGDVVELLISRGGRIMTLPATLAEKPNTTWRLVTPKQSDDQKSRMSAWLGTKKPETEQEDL